MGKTVICIATPLYAPDIGGPATHVALLERGLSKKDFELRIVKFSDVRGLPKILRHIVYFFKIFSAAQRSRCIYALDGASVGLPASLAAIVLGKKLVLRVGGDYAWEQGVQRFGIKETLDEFVTHTQPSVRVRMLQRIQSHVARRATVVIAPSEYLEGIIRTWGVRPERIQVIYSQPEINGSGISKSDARKKLKLHENEELILSAGRLVPWKGFEGLVDAMIRVQPHRPARLVIAGDGPGKTALLSHIEKTSAGSYVSLAGQLSQEELTLLLAAADMFVLNTKYEGLSHMLLEAFASHTPVITTPVGGNSELIIDGDTGLLVEQDDTRTLAASILKLLEDREFASALAERAFHSLSRFNPEIAIRKISSLFKAL